MLKLVFKFNVVFYVSKIFVGKNVSFLLPSILQYPGVCSLIIILRILMNIKCDINI